MLKELKEMKNGQKLAEEKRLLFETRMESKWDNFLKKVSQTQDRGKNRSQSRSEEFALAMEDDDFEDLDDDFPITIFKDVEKLEWTLRSDLTFKFRLVNKLFTFRKIKLACTLKLAVK